MTASHSAEARELALVDKVELRIALASDDEKLQLLLATYLAPLLLKLASEYSSVRNKVIAVCQHVNTRIKPENLQLPVVALIKQFQVNPQSQLIRHFDLLYIQQGFNRLSNTDRANLLPEFTSNIHRLYSASGPQASIVFNLFLQSLVVFSLPPKDSSEDTNLRTTLGISNDDAQYLSMWIAKLMLYKSTGSNLSPASLSKEDQDFLSLQGREGTWQTSTLANTKYACVRFVASGALRDEERLMPALLASADSNSRISGLAEDVLKRCLPEIDTDDEALIRQLFDLYLKSDASELPSSGSSAALRIRILGIVSKSAQSTSFAPEIRKIVKQDLVQTGAQHGRELNRLRSAVIQLLMTVARQANSIDLASINEDVLTSLKDFLDQQHDDRSSSELIDLRGRAFEIVGILASASGDSLLDSELKLLRWLFRCLSEERNKQVVFSISEALSLTIRPFQSETRPVIIQPLRRMLVEGLSEDSINPQASLHSILRFANRCLPLSDVVARWINISILGTKRDTTYEIEEEARKGLDPYWIAMNRNNTTAGELPTFQNMAAFLFSQQASALSAIDMALVATKFCRQCLFWWCLASEGQKLDFTIDWEKKLDIALRQDYRARRKICSALQTQRPTGSWENILKMFELSCQGIAAETNQRGSYACFILELVSVSPNELMRHMAPFFAAFLTPVLANDFDTRLHAAQIFGLLASHTSNADDVLADSVSQLLQIVDQRQSAIGAGINKVHGALVGLGYFASRRLCRDTASPIGAKAAQQAVSYALDIINASNESSLQDAALRTLGQLCAFSVVRTQDIERTLPVSSLVERLFKMARSGNDNAVLAMGHVGMILDESVHADTLQQLLEQLRALHETRQPETQFAVGEALANTACAWQSSAMQPYLLTDGPPPSSLARTTTLHSVVNSELEACKSPKPALRKACVIWLLCLLEYCGQQDEVLLRLPAFQAVFKRCISDRDELVQESASRGLGLVYERGSKELRDELVRDLISSFSDNKANMSGTVNEDTQLFEPGSLPTGDGSVTTYKDIMSLASEVGDPSLVYRFMSLASNNAIWANRAAFGRFGLSTVLADSSVDGHLANNPKMYPALYRYRFDPNSNVRSSMNVIWNSLIKDPMATVNAHFDLIMKDLLKNMTVREWRTRQASCAALCDILQGRKLVQIQPYIDQTWSQCFKVLDDIKETVRTGAASLARVLTNILVGNLESAAGSTTVIADLLRSVLPFILSTSGIESSADEVKMLSLRTLLDIVKKAKPTLLRPFVPDLIGQLLFLLTSFEPEAVNYIALNATNYNLTQSDIDDARLKSIRSSPIMEAIERALDTLDEATMAKTMPKLLETMRVAVGVPSKVGCSRVLVSLSTRKNAVFRPFANQALMAVEKRIQDRNETVSSSYAASVGYLARIASDEQILQTVKFTQRLYFGDADDDRPRFIVAEMFHAMARCATDRFNALASDLVPFVFFGRFDDTERVRHVFKETLDEVAPGPRVVSLYLPEILSLARAHLDSHKWTLKHAAAKTVSEAVQSLGASHGSIAQAHAELLWPPLQEALAQKNWDGKAGILEGLVVLVEKSERTWRCQGAVRREIKKIALREARRRNKRYQVAALHCLGQIAAALDADDMLHDVNDVATGVVEAAAQEMEVDGRENKAGDAGELVASAVEATFAAVRMDREAGVPDLLARARVSLDLAHAAFALTPTHLHSHTHLPTAAHGYPLVCAVFASLKRLCDTLRRHQAPEALSALVTTATPAGTPGFVDHVLSLISATGTALLPERSRSLRAHALFALCEAFPGSCKSHVRANTSLPAQLQRLIGEEKSVSIRNVLQSAQRCLDAAA